MSEQEPRTRRAPANPPAPGGVLHSRLILLLAFAFAVMADPVSSVTYAIEAALRALAGDLSLLIATMALVVAVVAVVIVNYHQLVGRFPQGGGAAAATGKAFGEPWAFLPIGALVVDFVLTIAISVAAAAAAIIAYIPELAGWRVPLTLLLLLVVVGLTWFGHLGRAVFALMTISFVAIGTLVIIRGFGIDPTSGPVIQAGGDLAGVSVLLAFPVAMALATGIEAPSSAIAQLGMLDDSGRRRFGRITLWLTLGIVGVLTLGLTALAVRLHVGIPAANSTLVADVARQTGEALFGGFQVASAALLLAAASSSFQAGPGLLKALARSERADGVSVGILPAWSGRTNRHHTPYWGVLLFLGVSAAVVVMSGARDQSLVLFYAVSVFVSFLAGLLAMARFSHGERRWASFALNAFGVVVVGFTLVVNLGRGYPIASLVASLAIAAVFHRLWVRSGRPRGVSEAEALGEEIIGEELAGS